MQILPSDFSHFSSFESSISHSLPTSHIPLLYSIMSVVGIDLGAQSTKIGVARNKGIDIVRITPRSWFGFIVFFEMDHDLTNMSNCADYLLTL